MATTGNEDDRRPYPGGVFATTHWSVVLAAKESNTPGADEAMEKLCRAYWPPIYAYIRRERHNATDAQDLTQEFFARLLAKDYLQHLRHQEGKFRSFLLTILKHFLSDERDKAGAQKRGGGKTFVSLDETSAEERYLDAPVNGLSPDQMFDRRWAQRVMERALTRLREEYVAGGKGALFEQLKDIQLGEHGETSYAEIGARLGMAEGAVASAVHRLRKRHREILRKEIAQTVARPEEIDQEIRNLLAILSQ
jgi:RNA polymerase sigma-70 factor (ECF subfamily)